LIAAPAFSDAIPIRQWNANMITHQKARASFGPSDFIRARSATESSVPPPVSTDNTLKPEVRPHHAATISDVPLRSASKEKSLDTEPLDKKKDKKKDKSPEDPTHEANTAANKKDRADSGGPKPAEPEAHVNPEQPPSEAPPPKPEPSIPAPDSTTAAAADPSEQRSPTEKKKKQRPMSKAPPPPSRVTSVATLSDRQTIDRSSSSPSDAPAPESPREAPADKPAEPSLAEAVAESLEKKSTPSRPQKKTFKKKDKSETESDSPPAPAAAAEPEKQQREPATPAAVEQEAAPEKPKSPRAKSDASSLKADARTSSRRVRPDGSSSRLSRRFEAKEIQLKEDEFYPATVRYKFTAENVGELSVEKGTVSWHGMQTFRLRRLTDC
jgi:hypothetical protein